MAKHYSLLHELARKNHVHLYYEAAVCGGIPALQAFKSGLAANEIHAVYGILNGTCNYILTAMEDRHLSFEESLAQAQDLGFAESDSHMDISGLDTLYKLCVLAADACHLVVPLDHCHCEGISHLSLTDIRYAQDLGYRIRLIGMVVRRDDAGLIVKVHPVMIDQKHPLAAVKNEFNAIFLKGDYVGEMMFYGKGAGALPTGSAVVADIMACLRGHHLSTHATAAAANTLVDSQFVTTRFYLRVLVNDHVGVLEKITAALGHNQVSVFSMNQRGTDTPAVAELVFITHETEERQMQHAIRDLDALADVRSVEAVIRVGLNI